MKRREARSLFWSIVGAILIVAACYAALLLRERQGEKPHSGPPSPPTEVAVAVELSEIPPPEGPKPPASELPEETVKETAAAPPSPTENQDSRSLASNVPSENKGTDSSSLDKKPEASQNATAKAGNELPSSDSPDKIPVPIDPPVRKPAGDGPATNPPTPVDPKNAPTQSAPRASTKGQIPAFHHIGHHQEFLRQFPRLEVAWVADPRSEDPANPRTLLEVVWSPLSKQLAWKNNSTGNSSADFALVTRLHDTSGRIVESNPGSMSLWKEREKISELAGVAPASAKIMWGYLRHKVEVRQMTAVRESFLKASAENLVTYDPMKSEYIEVEWGATRTGQLGVVRATFVGNAGGRSDLLGSRR